MQFFSRNDPNAPVPAEKKENKPEVARKPYQFLLVSPKHKDAGDVDVYMMTHKTHTSMDAACSCWEL